MKNKIIKITTVIMLLSISAQAEMKCSAGKCSGSKAGVKVNFKKIKIEKNEIEKNEIEKNTPVEKKILKKERITVEQLFNVRTIQVKKLLSSKKQINYGYIVVDDSRKVDIVSWYSGYVNKLYADTIYKKVKKGEKIAKVYSPEVYKAKQDYLNALKYNDSRKSKGMLYASEEKLRLLNIDTEEIKLIKKERRISEFTTIYAPISGWIFEKNINLGSSFKKNQKLFQIINIDKVWLEAKLFQNELEKLNKLSKFDVKVEGISKIFKAEKKLLYPMLNTKEATATLRLLIDNNEEELKPGMYVKLHASEENETKLVIPRTAVIRKDGKWYVFLSTDFEGEYEPIEVKIEPLDNKYYIVLNGLSNNESIVNNALFMMDSDAQINSIY